MKRLFLTFAAMLLMSVSAFAQSSETPLKGDVNEDGVVDVADIAAIIKIIKENATPQTTYYWYVGKDEQLLGKNGTSYNLDLSVLPTVTSINDIYSESQLVGSEDNNIYVVCPTEWVDQFKLTDLDNNELIFTDKTSQIISNVTGYSILRGAAKTTDTTIKIIRI